MSALPVALPSLHEQRRIVDILGSMDEAIEAASKEPAWSAYEQILESWMAQSGKPLQLAVSRSSESVAVQSGDDYRILGLERSGRGLIESGVVSGKDITYKRLYRVGPNQLVYRKLTAWEGPIAVSPAGQVEGWVSTEFPVFDIHSEVLLPGLMGHMCRWPGLWHRIGQRLVGSVQRRKRLNPEQLVQIEVPMPELDEQEKMLDLLDELYSVYLAQNKLADRLRDLRSNLLTVLLSGEHEIPTSYDDQMEEITV